MALTYSPAGELGSDCPDFRLRSVDGRTYRRQDFSDHRALVIMFICNHCPYVRAVEDRLIDLQREMTPLGVAFAAICSNDPSDYPEDSPGSLLDRWRSKDYRFPYLIDETQEIAKAFGAVCTPDLYLYDSGGKLKYRGRLDDSWKSPRDVRRRDLKEAIDAVLAGRPIADQIPSMGCSIKWKAV